MKPSEIKDKFLKFFESKGHAIIPSASLVPENDPTVLFTTAGMHPLVPYLIGEKHPAGKRLVNSQKCIRTGDIDEVGDAWHITYFNMLGNWSLGDYWKQEAIEWALEFLEDLGINKKELEITCFAGDEDAPKDEEAANIWKSLGIKKIKFLGKKDNWWGPAGETGPCGPDTEIFWKGVEIWNLVFMEYNRTKHGKYINLKQRNVDTGMGLERMTALLNNKKSIYPEKIKTKEDRIIYDHTRASIEIIKDGVSPTNSERGYVLRKLIRRALQYTDKLPTDNKIIKKEQEQYNRIIRKGLKKLKLGKIEPFDLYQSYGLPFEIIKKHTKISKKEFNKLLKEHQEKSRTAAKGKFKAGLADHSEETTKLHTATHLLHQALKDVLGNQVAQKGSNINQERLRFDFNHDKKLTARKIKKIESIINNKIKENLKVTRIEDGPISYYSIGNYSKEKCAGPHINEIGKLGKFKIIKEESSSRGVRRIRACLF